MSEENSFRNEQGQINSPADAWDLAYIEESSGVPAALQREEVLEKEHYNTEVMELLKEEFPYAFQEVVDKDSKEKVYVAGMSIFQNNLGKFKPTEKSQELINTEFNDVYSNSRGNDRIAACLLTIGNGISGMLVSKRGILGFTSLSTFDDKNVFNEVNIQRSFSISEMSEDRQARILKALDFVNRYGKELNTEDLNTIENLRKKILSIKTPAATETTKTELEKIHF